MIKDKLLKIKHIGLGGVFKTIYYNFKLFPLPQAVFFPLILSSKTIIRKTKKGAIKFTSERLRPGLLSFGISHLNCSFSAPNFINIEGRLIIHGSGAHDFGPGANLRIRSSGQLEIGDNYSVGHFCRFIISSHSVIGDNNMHSWENLFMDTDSHPIYNKTGDLLNYPKGFHIGNNVWIGAKCTILKGVKISDGIILATRSLVNKNIDAPKSIYASSRLLRSDVDWNRSAL